MFSFVFQIFNGNSGSVDVVKHSLVSFTRARFVKFQPTEFNNHKALRVEIYGVPVPAGRVLRNGLLFWIKFHITHENKKLLFSTSAN